MSVLHATRLRTRRAAVAVATVGAAGSLLAGLAGAATASAATVHPAAHPNGTVTVDGCTSVSGSLNFTPGLRTTLARNTTAVLTATTAGCSDAFSGPMAGTGSLSEVLTGSASLAAENFSGTFTINWPGGSLAPSNGTVSVRAQGNHQYAMTGTVTSGADTGAFVQLGYLTTLNKGNGTKRHPVVAQQFVNTSQLSLTRNGG